MNARSLFRALVRTCWTTLGLFTLMSIIGVIAVLSLPESWTSSSRIAIERPDGALGETQANAQELLYQRVEFLRSSILSRENLARTARTKGYVLDQTIAEKDAALAEVALYTDVAERLSLEVENVSVVNRFTGKLGLLPLAISVNFEGKTPDEALMMATVFTEQLLEVDRERERLTAQYRNEFLESGAVESAEKLEQIEQRIAAFKRDNALELPELQEFTIKRMETVDASLTRSLENVASLREEAAFVETEIATASPDALLIATDGTRIESVGEQLARVRVELSAAQARYSDRHPEVIRLTRDAAALRGAAGGLDTAELERELESSRVALAEAGQRYGASHPEILRLKRLIDTYERTLQAAKTSAPLQTSAPSNPNYNRLIARREAVNSRIAREQIRSSELAGELATLEARLQRMPNIESEWLALEREHESAVTAHEELRSARESVALDAQLRDADLLEAFTLVEPPILPLLPSSPNRRLLLVLVVLLALFASLSIAVIRALFNNAIWELSSEDVGPQVSITPIPVF